MNKGYVPGLNPDGWRTYQPRWVVTGALGASLTQPILDNQFNPYQFGRYNLIQKQLCVVQINMSVLGNQTLGSGGAYAWSLPFPALRMQRETAEPVCIGRGMAYISFGPQDENTPLAVTLADPYASLNGQEDRYFQAYAPYILDWGSDTVASAGNSKTVTHHANVAFNAQDVTVNNTDENWTSTTHLRPPWIDSITSTQFKYNAAAQAASGGAGFSYKIRAELPTGQQGALVSPTVPYDLASKTSVLSPFANFFFHLVYPIAA